MRPDLLIIDDSRDQLEIMKVACDLVDPSCSVLTAESGVAALDLLRSDVGSLPKVIMLDLRMPGKDGQEVLSELKSDPILKRIPVCIFSSANIPSEVCDCYERGASFYFKKPLGLTALTKFLEQFKGICFNYASHCSC